MKDNAQSRVPLEYWLGMIKVVDWATPEDISMTFASADILGNGCQRVVFNIGGNHYRMICAYGFGDNMIHLFVKWIGTHADYDRICDQQEQYTISQF